MKWTADRDDDGNFLLAGTDIVISDEETNVVCLVPHGLQENLPLIAAAPDLLAALQGILPYIMPEITPEPGPEYTHYHASKAVRAAIGKATKG